MKTKHTHKKNIFSCFFFSFLVGFAFLGNVNIVNANEYAAPEGGEKRLLKVSAYYSPLPGQLRYLRGNYEAEIRLNGQGTNGADGTAVYQGMLAAPKTYSFGTQIFIPGLGTGTVHDRGGAIVSAGERNQAYDRIDVWMGYGEEGLARALHWGMRIVEGVVYEPGKNLKEDLDYTQVPEANLLSLTISTKVANAIKTKINKTDETNIKILQKNLKELGFFSDKITGKYGIITEKAVLKFQLHYKVISSKDSIGAGNYGPKTQAKMKHVLEQKKQEKIFATSHFTKFLPAGMSEGSSGQSVINLQKVLKKMGYFEGDYREKFGEKTKWAVINFQKGHKIIGSETEWGAGVFGPKTQAKIFEILQQRKSNTNIPKKILTEEFNEEQKEKVSKEAVLVDPETGEKKTPKFITKKFDSMRMR